MINTTPLRIRRATPHLQAFTDTIDRVNERYYEGEALSDESKALFGLLETAAGDVGAKNEYSKEITDNINNLVSKYKGRFEDRNFQTEVKRLVRESQKDPRLKAFRDTLEQEQLAKKARAASQLDSTKKLLFDNNEPIRSYQDEEGNWKAGQFKGEQQADYLAAAKRAVGIIKADGSMKTQLGQLEGVLNGIRRTGWQGVSKEKIMKIAKPLAEDFLQSAEGDQWARLQNYQREQNGEAPLSEEDLTIAAGNLLVRANANQLSSNSTEQWQIPEFLNKTPEVEETEKPKQEYGANVSYNTNGGGWKDKKKGLLSSDKFKEGFNGSPVLSTAMGIFNMLRSSDEMYEDIYKDEDYRKDVVAATEIVLGSNVKDVLTQIQTEEGANLLLMDLGLDARDLRESDQINIKEISKDIQKIKTKEDLYNSPLGLAIANKYREDFSEFKENLVVNQIDEDEAKLVKFEKLENRFLDARAITKISSNGSTEVLGQEEIQGLRVKLKDQDLMVFGETSKYNTFVGNNPQYINGSVYKDTDGNEYVVSPSPSEINPNDINYRQKVNIANDYALIKGNHGREVDIRGNKVKYIASQQQLISLLDRITSNYISTESTEEEVNEMDKTYQAVLSMFNNKTNLAFLEDQEGNLKIGRIENIIDDIQ